MGWEVEDGDDVDNVEVKVYVGNIKVLMCYWILLTQYVLEAMRLT